jgi:phage-related protein
MPNVIFYREEDGSTPMLDWLDRLPQRARVQCIGKVELLKDLGHELRRPHADYVRDGIHELRAKSQGVNYRMLYFFFGRRAVVLSHGIAKQQAAVPPIEIERAKRRKQAFEAEPYRHTHKEI